ncbi:MgtC/SapB family protein [Acidipropionibacterium jensenii]|uniref:MgtC/SapB family protein n=1 Tax=Acidipropionibacterium jensenii TaxID=1749 RepID=UPI00214B6E96|nr:MgtC/SapB family protein [Acidipropionibacterium jensenii]
MVTQYPLEIALGQGWTQLAELLLAFVLTALVGLERSLRGKGAGLRTQAIVGVSSALFLQVGKYGFFDLVPLLGGDIRIDPSRVAAQVVSGVGFLGAGLIMTQHSRVRGLTTAASVWESSAIGMAAGAGLWLLAVVVTVLHFVITLGLGLVEDGLLNREPVRIHLDVRYLDGHGLLRELLSRITDAGWSVSRASPRAVPGTDNARLILELKGPRETSALVAGLTGTEGVLSVDVVADPETE